MRHIAIWGLVVATLVTSMGCALGAAVPIDLGVFKAWTAWQATDQYGKICFISVAPDTMEPTVVNGKALVRGPVHLIITHRDKEPAVSADGTFAKDKKGQPIFQKVRNEVQAQLGYPLQPTTTSLFHTAEIDGKPYSMRSVANDPSTPGNEDEAAWIASSSDELGFVDALKNGTALVVHATSARGTKTTDTYSLGGITAAMAAIDRACP